MNINLILMLMMVVVIKCETSSDLWRSAGKITGLLLNKCLLGNKGNEYVLKYPNDGLFVTLQKCLEKRGLRVLDQALSEDVIEIMEGVELVKFKQGNFTNNNRTMILYKSYNEMKDWKSQFVTALKLLFNTHILKIKLKNLQESEGRGRRRQNMFSQLLMFGVIAAAFIVIPMGFQFLAILGGKALLLAKMALLLTSIQGLKKIATSNFNYGLYSTYGVGHHQPWQYDRQYGGGEEHHLAPPGGSGENYDFFHPRNDIVYERT